MPVEPVCPQCGCNGYHVVGRGSWWGVATCQCACDHCGHRFPLPGSLVDGDEDDEVLYHVVRCPLCDEPDCPVTTTRRPIRHHKCRRCGHSFKSRESD